MVSTWEVLFDKVDGPYGVDVKLEIDLADGNDWSSIITKDTLEE